MDGLSRPRFMIPERLRLDVLGYYDGICQRCIDPENRRPMILTVVGLPGTGKSFMTWQILREAGVVVDALAASAFSGPHEGMSVRPFRDKILELGGGRNAETLPPRALLIEDFDRGVGGRDEEGRDGHTVNSDLLITEIMSYADKPNRIVVPEDLNKGAPAQTFRVLPTAIVMTANDTTRIHFALRRFGRSRIIKWQPTSSEMVGMVQCIFPTVPDDAVRSLVEHFPHQPISFYENLLGELRERQTQEALSQYHGDFRRAFTEDAIRQRGVMLARESYAAYQLEELTRIGKELVERQEAVNLLKNREVI